MSRAQLCILAALVAIPAFAATPDASEKPIDKTSPLAPVTQRIPKSKKQLASPFDAPGTPVDKGHGPIVVGPPVETHISKASGKKFDLRSLPFIPPVKFERPEREEPSVTPTPFQTSLTTTPPSGSAPVLPSPSAPAPAPLSNFDGLDFANWGAGHPPDTNGDVGPAYYIQTINTSIGVFRKSDGARVAAFTFNTFMSQGNFGNLCDTDNFGDPVVLYDSFEDRWVISDFAFKFDGSGNIINPPGAFQCVAVSMSGDPVSGGWNYYSINTSGGLGDYPKLGIWPDGIYMSVNMFDYPASGAFENSRLYAFNKSQMYSGSPTVQVISFDLPTDQFTVLPANARLQTGTPPAGSPNYFASVWKFLNAIEIWKFHADFAHPSLSSVTGPFDSTMTFWWEQYSGTGGRAPTPANSLDTLYPRLMVQNQYTNIGGTESLWNGQTVGAGNPTSNLTSAQSAVRYYQVNVTGGTVAATTPQSFTYSPDATIFRYMPSVAVNRAGDMAIGYSKSNATTNPAIAYAGRLAGDPVNSITQTEQLLFQGTGSQSGTCGGTCTRWGDYSAMTLDPNGCTFWYTNEYYVTNGLNFNTRIGSFAFPSCTPVGAGGTVSGTVTATAGGTPIAGATVTLGARSTTTDANGNYAFNAIPAGNYTTMTASYPGYAPSSTTNIPVTDGGTTTENFSLAAASSGSCYVDTTQSDFQAGVLTNVDVTTTPGDAVLTKPNLLDQQNNNVNPTGFGITNTFWAGQTFKAAISGKLVRADIELFCASCTAASPNITVSIRATTGATPVPTGADLATATITGFNDGGAGGLKTAIFSTPFTVTAGTTYAVIFRNAAVFANGTVAFTCSCASAPFTDFNPYANGGIVSSNNSGATWAADTTAGGRDINFRVYINSGYSTTGTIVSNEKDGDPGVGNLPNWSTLSFTSTTPANTSVKFQIAGSNNVNGPFSFVGPDGTSATFFTTSGASIAQFNGLRYLEYEALLGTTDTTVTPALSDVTMCFADVACPPAGSPITPSNNPVCALTPGLTASVPAGSSNYSWSITNGTITAGGTSSTVTFTAGAGGSVGLQVTYTDPGGCVKVSTLSLPIDVLPVPAVVISNTQTVAVSGPGTFTLNFNGATTSAIASNASAAAVQAALNALPTIGGVGGSVVVSFSAGVYTVTFGGTLTGPQPQLVATPAGGATAGVAAAPVCPGSPGNQASGPGGLSYSWSITNGTITNGQTGQTVTYTAPTSGEVVLQLTVTDGAGCSATSAPAHVPLDTPPAAPTITPGGPTTFTYPGNVTLNSSSSANGYQWFLGGSPIGGATSQAYFASASGNYTVAVSDALGCFSPQSGITTVTVNKATPVVTATGGTFVYDGNPHPGTGSATGGAGETLTFTMSYTGTGATTYGPTAAAPTLVGTYSVVAHTDGDANNNAGDSAPAAITINKANPVVTATGGTFTYDGTPKAGSGTATGGGGESLTVTTLTYNGTGTTTYGPSSTAPSLAGTYTVTAHTDGDANNNAGDSSATALTINKFNPLMAAHGGTFVYNGLPEPATGQAIGGAGENLPVTLTYEGISGTVWGPTATPPTNVGIYLATAHTVGDANNNAEDSLPNAIRITKATPTINLNVGPFTYNGNPQGGATATGGGGESLAVTLTFAGTGTTTYGPSSTAPSLAGTYTLTVHTDGDANNNPVDSTGNALTINKFNPLMSAHGGTFTYNGSPEIGTGQAFGGAGEILPVTITYQGISGTVWGPTATPPTNFGVYLVTAHTVGDANNNAEDSLPNALRINKAAATIVVTPYCVDFDGFSHTAPGTATGVINESLPGLVLTGTTHTAAGTYIGDPWTFTDPNYNGQNSTVDDSIVNAVITAPISVVPGATGIIASVGNAGIGATYNWSITNGTITAGAGTNSITFTAGAAGTLTLQITVTTSTSCASTKSASVSVIPPVSVTSVSPTSGSINGHTAVTVNGTGFAAGATVTFGGNAATSVVVVNSTKITAVTPAHAAGAVNVTVTNTDTSTATLTNGYTYVELFDPNGDHTIDPSDIFYLISYLFLHGPAPVGGVAAGDANGDGVVDPADIFYLVNYLFLGGPKPYAEPVVHTSSVSTPMKGSISLGQPVLRGDHYFIPVVVDGEGSAMSLRLHFDAPGAAVTIHRAAGLQPVFEDARHDDRALSYLVAYADTMHGVVAEIEVPAGSRVSSIAIDSDGTLLCNRDGIRKATVAGGTLTVSGVSIDAGRQRVDTPRSER